MSRDVGKEPRSGVETKDVELPAPAPASAGALSEITESTHYTGKKPPAPGATAPGVFESRAYKPVLICLTGSQRGQRRALGTARVVVGRSLSCDWQLEDTAASRQHAVIEYENMEEANMMPRCFVTDLGSRNGTQVNGREIKERTALRERDRILIGTTVIGFFVRDEGELRHDESLYLSATSDVLTGLDNRRQLRIHLRHQLARARRQGHAVSFLLLDLDHFKDVNDRFGHDTGDEALRHIADILRSACREGDLVARWGGEEFAICLPDTDLPEAFLLADRLRKAIEAKPLQAHGETIPITTSIGVTCYVPGDGADSLFQRADQMLYRAKEAGRNRVEVDDNPAGSEARPREQTPGTPPA